MTPLRIKVFILLVCAGVVPLLWRSQSAAGDWLDFGLQAFKISGTLSAIVAAYVFYGWRLPLLDKLASGPDIRGTWRVETGAVDSLKAPERSPVSPKSYIVIRQTDARIGVHVLWDDNSVSELDADTPYIFHNNKYAFAATYLNQPSSKTAAVGAFITYSPTSPNTLTLRYRTDDGLTGELTAESHVRDIFLRSRRQKNATQRVLEFSDARGSGYGIVRSGSEEGRSREDESIRVRAKKAITGRDTTNVDRRSKAKSLRPLP
jgi:hypothetical protein